MPSLSGPGTSLLITALSVAITSWISASSAKLSSLLLLPKNVMLPGACAIMPSTFIVLADGSKPDRSAPCAIENGNSKNSAANHPQRANQKLFTCRLYGLGSG